MKEFVVANDGGMRRPPRTGTLGTPKDRTSRSSWTLAEMPFRCLVESKPKIATVTSGKLANVYLQKQN